jgi:hypothetical protein
VLSRWDRLVLPERHSRERNVSGVVQLDGRNLLEEEENDAFGIVLEGRGRGRDGSWEIRGESRSR